jgi:hypothetical protein
MLLLSIISYPEVYDEVATEREHTHSSIAGEGLGCAWRGWSTALRLRCSRARASYYVAAAAQRSGHWVLGRDGRPGRPTQNTKLARACTVGSSVYV